MGFLRHHRSLLSPAGVRKEKFVTPYGEFKQYVQAMTFDAEEE